MRDQNNIQWQNQGSRCQIKDKDLQARKEEYSRLYDWIWDISYKGQYRQTTCHLLTEEEYASRHNQDDIGIFTDSGFRDTQRVESSDHISRIRIWVHRRTTELQDRIRNNI